MRILIASMTVIMLSFGCQTVGSKVKSDEGAAQEGATCGDGVFGTPNIQCAPGLECVPPEGGTAPRGPEGSSSAVPGTCKKITAKLGEACGDGTFGVPNIQCAEGLVCVPPEGGTAPRGPAGSSSAVPGSCQLAGAKVGESCSDGVFGTPNRPCRAGLTCKYPDNSSAPRGPAGSSSAVMGKCVDEGAKAGKTCGDGTFGQPNIKCAQGLVCKYPNGSSAPRGPAGSSSAVAGKCAKP